MQKMKQIISSHNKTVLESTKIKEKQETLATAGIKKILPAQRPVSPNGSGIQGNCGTETLEKTGHLHRNNRK